MSPPSGSTKRGKESSSKSNGTTTSVPSSHPSAATLTTLHSSDWKTLYQDKKEKELLLDFFHRNREKFDRESIEFDDDDGNFDMCALYRFQCLYLTEMLQQMSIKNSDNKAKMKDLISKNHLYSHHQKYRKVIEEIWQNLFNTKVMYSIFRRTPFAAHMVCSFR